MGKVSNSAMKKIMTLPWNPPSIREAADLHCLILTLSKFHLAPILILRSFGYNA